MMTVLTPHLFAHESGHGNFYEVSPTGRVGACVHERTPVLVRYRGVELASPFTRRASCEAILHEFGQEVPHSRQ